MIQGKRNNLWAHGFPDNIPTVEVLQWGYGGRSNGIHVSTINFPVAFSSICYIVVASTRSLGTNNASNSGSVDSLSLSTFSAVFETSGGYWSALGI